MSDLSRRPDDHSLYAVLGEPAPAGSVHGETRVTRQKETLDADQEAFDFEELASHA